MSQQIRRGGAGTQVACSVQTRNASTDFAMKLPALRAVLTRPADRQRVLAQRLRARGWEVLSLPALELVETGAPILEAQFQAKQFDWVMFVSRGAWRLYQARSGAFWPASTGIAVVGQGTALAIAEDFTHGRVQIGSDVHSGSGSRGEACMPFVQSPKILMPDQGDSQDSEGLWCHLKPRLTDGSRVLIVAGRHGRTWLRDQIRAHGAQCDVLECYQRVAVPVSEQAGLTLKQWSSPDELATSGVWLFTSRHSIEADTQALSEIELLHRISPAGVLVTHERLVQPALDWLGQTRAAQRTPVRVCQPDDDCLETAFEQIRLQSLA